MRRFQKDSGIGGRERKKEEEQEGKTMGLGGGGGRGWFGSETTKRVQGEDSETLVHRVPQVLFTIISDTDCLILILLVKKYLSRYKNKPTANYKLSGLKIYSCLCGGG